MKLGKPNFDCDEAARALPLSNSLSDAIVLHKVQAYVTQPDMRLPLDAPTRAVVEEVSKCKK